VQRHLFEPFFSSESRSSGLGLFLCRELCERHGATIGYERRSLSGVGAEGNAFSIVFAPAARRQGAADTIGA
jgi:two-component system sensor histidine kinase PilS (NtrC family)